MIVNQKLVDFSSLNNFVLQQPFMAEVNLGVYQHYKGKLYRVIGVAHHSETLEELVVYQALYDDEKFGKNALWVRPKKMFLESVTVGGKQVPRFKFLDK